LTPEAFLILAAAALLIAAVAATGAKVLHEYSVSELEEYSQRRQRRERFAAILDSSEDAALAAESLQTAATACSLLAAAGWMLRGGVPPAPMFAAGIAIAAAVFLLTCVWLPWAVAEVWSSPFLVHSWRFWRALSFVLWPLTIWVKVARGMLRRLAGSHDEAPDELEAFEDEVRAIVSAGMHEGHLEEDAREMIEGVIELGDSDVSDIMTPRSAVDALGSDMDWPAMLEVVVQSGRTRLPVYHEKLDNIVGVLYVKDLLPDLAVVKSKRRHFRELVRPAWFVPGTKPLDDMLREFLRTRSHLAIVVDEYESVAGIVTIEDVLEEIVGEIVDESDKEAPREIIRIDDVTAEAVGRAHLAELNEVCGFDFPEPDEYNTIGGFLMHQFGEIPQAGQRLEWNGLRITVLEATRRRVDRVRIERQVDARAG
jgi:CBS domain containing-hemolysin-like protein